MIWTRSNCGRLAIGPWVVLSASGSPTASSDATLFRSRLAGRIGPRSRAGQGIVAVDGIGRAGSAMWFPHGREFATLGLVITSPRTQAQGTGHWLMEQVFERCGDRNLSLNSVDAAYHLYLSLGFRKRSSISGRERSCHRSHRCRFWTAS